MFASHSGAKGRWYAAHYRALERRLGPFDDVTRSYAAACSALWCGYREDSLTAEAAVRERRTGRGRRPNSQAIGRLKKRAALSWGSYDQALRRLEELAKHRPAASPMATIAREPEARR